MSEPNMSELEIEQYIEAAKAIISQEESMDYDYPAVLLLISGFSEYYRLQIQEHAEFWVKQAEFQEKQEEFNGIIQKFIEQKRKQYENDTDRLQELEMFSKLYSSALLAPDDAEKNQIIEKLIDELEEIFTGSTVNDAKDYQKCIKCRSSLTQLLKFAESQEPQKQRRSQEFHILEDGIRLEVGTKISTLLVSEEAFIQKQIESLSPDAEINDALISKSKEILALIPPDRVSDYTSLNAAIKNAEVLQLQKEIKNNSQPAVNLSEQPSDSTSELKKEEITGHEAGRKDLISLSLGGTIAKRYYDIAFEGKDPAMAFLRKTARKNEIAFLQAFIKKVNLDEGVNSYQRLALLKGAIAYISAVMDKERSPISVGMGQFKTMLSNLNKQLDKMCADNNELFLKPDLDAAIEHSEVSFQNYVEKNKEEFGVENKLTKKILKDVANGKLQSSESSIIHPGLAERASTVSLHHQESGSKPKSAVEATNVSVAVTPQRDREASAPGTQVEKDVIPSDNKAKGKRKWHKSKE